MLGLPRIIFGTLMLAVVAAGAAAAGWWFFVREDDKLATNAPAVPTELVNRTVTPSAGGLTFRIIPERSEAAYFADEKLARLPLPSKAKGATNDIEGEFHLTDDGLSLDERAPSTFTVNLRTLKSDEARRDSRVQNDALQTGQFPTATFVATRVTGVDTSVPAGEEHTFQLTGTLDLHGVKKEVTWEVKARRDGNVMTALATVSFEFQDFDITPPNIAGFVSVQDKITLQVSVVAEAVG